ncbi:MAG: 4-hydroxy-tetrahydrodipicolinate synthase [Clostridiales bacterium]|jgi:4-hydroxy-tetrahydrodipicolinate synthase|nr:4-hydroxy-tetrahydrodipicolinate synthase [Clostridiales bacterium]
MTPIFKGCATALITPFTAAGDIDYPALDNLVEYQLDNGIDALVITGTTGEASTLTDPEHIAVIARAVKQVRGRVPVIAGTGSNHTEHGVNLSRAAQDAGADALLLVTPYYNKTTQAGLIAHYTATAQAVDIPIILYSVPGRTGMGITPETMAALSQVKGIVGLKDATGDLGYAVKVRQLCGDRIALYSGNDDVAVPLMSVGGLGVISVLSNIMPRATRDMTAAFLAGDVQKAGRDQVALKGIIDALFMETNPIPVKYAAARMGLCEGHLRMPLVTASEAVQNKMDALLKQHGLI